MLRTMSSSSQSALSMVVVTSNTASPRVLTFAPTLTLVTSLLSADDSKVDYTSLLGVDDKRRRFSEDVVDTSIKDSIRVQKMYRKLQRQVHSADTQKESVQTFPIFFF